MTCSERRDAIFLYAAGALDPAEAEALRAHLATNCPTCAGALAEAEAALASLPLALTPVAPAPATKDALMARVRATPAATPSTARRPGGRFTLGSLVTYSGLAAAVAALVTGGLVWRNARQQIDSLANVRDILLAERMQLVSLADPANASPATGRVYWDIDRGQWGVVVFNMKPPPAGQAYQLWAIPSDGGAPMPMDTFDVDSAGKAMFMQPVPKTSAGIKAAAITMEPAGGSKSPTMPIRLVGEVR